MSSIDRRSFLVSAATAAGAAAAASCASAAPAAAQGAQTAPAGAGAKLFAPISLDHLKGGLDGLSPRQLEQHEKLYQGYVNRANALLSKLAAMTASGQHLNEQKAPTAEYAELKRRYGWEFNGVVLHELYFKNLKKGSGDLAAGSPLAKAAERDYGSIQGWWGDFMATAKMPGVGWALCVQDPRSKRLVNLWINSHEEGHVAGYAPIVVLDLWEHAFVGDYLPTERAKYLAVWEKSVDWDAAASRLS